jgi:glycine cleavage system H protein
MEGKMNTPDHLKYNNLDEWIHVEGTFAIIGISDYAQDQLSDVVYADIKVSPGDVIKQGDLVAVVESVKASSDITAPLSGKVLEINNELNTSPELINAEPYGLAWMMKIEISNPDEINRLLDAKSYRDYRNM